VRAVNSGVSAAIDPNGRVTQKSYANDPYRHPRGADGMVTTVPKMAGGHTLFVAVGNLFAYLCLAATLLLLGAAFARYRRLRSA
jgi:apolipoprotein N-acyltransferase